MQSNQTFLFYDLETSGINNSFDQILQFGAVRTDIDFNEIERFNFFVKLNPDTTPSPEATLIHCISIAQVNSQGISEYEAVSKIHKIINAPGTISIGYNTLGFDDEFLRFAFFKNMLSSYSHQYKNNCSRADLFPIVACYHLFFNQALKWPEILTQNNNQKISLKLEDLNSVNDFYSGGQAHDALSDVLVTVELAKKLKNANQQIWDFLLDKFNKQNDEKVLNQFDAGINIDGLPYKQAIAVSGIFGYDKSFMSAVLDLGQHRHYKNQEIFLRLDNYLFSNFIEEFSSLKNKHWKLIIIKKWGDAPIILPAKSRFLEKLSSERLNLIKTNKDFLKNNSQIFADFIHYVLEYKHPVIENIDSDAAIYQSDFMTSVDEKICNLFHNQSIEQKAQMLPKLPHNYYERAIRIIGRLDFSKLPEKYQSQFQEYLNKIVSSDSSEMPVDHAGKVRRTIEEIFHKIQNLRSNNNLTEKQHSLLYELEEYLF